MHIVLILLCSLNFMVIHPVPDKVLLEFKWQGRGVEGSRVLLEQGGREE